MTKTELLALAERVEALTGPDRETDYRIAKWRSGAKGSHLKIEQVPPLYTASLDAAMTLVPEGCLFHVRTFWDGMETRGYARVITYADDAEECDGKRYIDDYAEMAATPAQALTAAALYAHAAAY